MASPLIPMLAGSRGLDPRNLVPLVGKPRRLVVTLVGAALVGGLLVPTTAFAAGPSVSINPASNQFTPTHSSPINLVVSFSDPVEGFTSGDVTIGGTAGGTKAVTVTGGPKIYNVAISGMTTSGFVTASIPAGVAFNPASEPNSASNTSYPIEWWLGPLTLAELAAGQASPTNISPINFTVEFTDPVEGFTSGDVTIQGTAGGTKTVTVTGGPKLYNVAVSGMTTSGEIRLNVASGVAFNPAGEPNHSVIVAPLAVWQLGGPTVTVNQAAGQADPTGTSPINFTVMFASATLDFRDGDVTIGGTAGGTKTAAVSGSGTTYNVAVSGMTTAGTIIATIPASVATDYNNRPNLASTSADNTVAWVPAPTPVGSSIILTTSAPTPPGAKAPVILWGQGFTLAVQSGMNGANRSFELQGTRDELTWTTITTLTTDPNGRASFFYRPVTNLFYRAVFAGAPDLAGATSNQVRTVVRELAVLRPANNGSTKPIGRDSSVTFTTTVRPARPELTAATVSFFFYRQVSGAWKLQTKRDVAIDSTGRARTTFKFTSLGQWYVRSQAGPTPYNANSVFTPIERYRVG